MKTIEILLALPIDLLRVFGFGRLADRIDGWFAFRALMRSFRKMTKAFHGLGTSAKRAAEGFARLAVVLRESRLSAEDAAAPLPRL